MALTPVKPDGTAISPAAVNVPSLDNAREKSAPVDTALILDKPEGKPQAPVELSPKAVTVPLFLSTAVKSSPALTYTSDIQPCCSPFADVPGHDGGHGENRWMGPVVAL